MRYKKKKTLWIRIIILTVFIFLLLFLLIIGFLSLRDIFSDRQIQEPVSVEIAVENAVDETGSEEAETETEAESELPTEPQKIRVILDAGHGGNDGGTSSGKLLEKSVNLDIAMRMKPLLEEKGLEVIMTREEDEYLSLEDRAYLANIKGGELFVSIHCNYYKKGSSISGVECYYYEKAQEGKRCAETIIAKLKEGGKIAARNAKDADYYVLKNTSMTAVLIEVGYLSSKTDQLNLGSSKYKDTMAEELTESVWTYLQMLQDEKAEEEESQE